MQTSKTLARLYCPNPKDPTEGLRQKANGVWERNEVIDGKRKSFSSRDPIEAWRKRSEYIITREERRQEEQLLEELGPLFEDVAERTGAGNEARHAKILFARHNPRARAIQRPPDKVHRTMGNKGVSYRTQRSAYHCIESKNRAERDFSALYRRPAMARELQSRKNDNLAARAAPQPPPAAQGGPGPNRQSLPGGPRSIACHYLSVHRRTARRSLCHPVERHRLQKRYHKYHKSSGMDIQPAPHNVP